MRFTNQWVWLSFIISFLLKVAAMEPMQVDVPEENENIEEEVPYIVENTTLVSKYKALLFWVSMNGLVLD